MITYAERACFRELHQTTRKRAVELVARVSSAWGNELRCHELARALRVLIGDQRARGGGQLEVVDGHCGPVEHSWLVFEDGLILDAYAPGRLPAVQLVDPMAGGYRRGAARQDIRQDIVTRLVGEMLGRRTA